MNRNLIIKNSPRVKGFAPKRALLQRATLASMTRIPKPAKSHKPNELRTIGGQLGLRLWMSAGDPQLGHSSDYQCRPTSEGRDSGRSGLAPNACSD